MVFVALGNDTVNLGQWKADTAQTGFWNVPSTWSSNTAPGDREALVIPEGVHVTVGENSGTYNGMKILLYGTLEILDGKSLRLAPDGEVEILSKGTLKGSSTGQIAIGEATVWSGDSGEVAGPYTCNALGCANYHTLAVELIGSKATVGNGFVEISWTTAVSGRGETFTLWRSEDFQNWETLAQVAGTEGSQYTYLDYEVNAGNNYYYRLSHTGRGQIEEYVGETMKAGLPKEGPSLPGIYPNPATDEVNISVPDEWVGGKGQILDMSGHHSGLAVPLVSEVVTLEVNALDEGTYFVRVVSPEGKVEVHQLVVR